MTFDVLAQLEASDLFEDESVNWRYCRKHATFSHKEACEFIINLPEDNEHWAAVVKEMDEFGCTVKFIEECGNARRDGAARILFYA